MYRTVFIAAVVGAGILLPSLLIAQNQQAQPTRYGERDQYGTIADTGNIGDFPTALVAAVPEARARATAASANHDRAVSAMGQVVARLQKELESAPEMKLAILEAREAYRALEDARARALAPINGLEEVLAAESMRKSISRQIHDQHSSDAPDGAQVVALATLKMEIAARIREKEALALATDPAVIEARSRYIVAAMKVDELRASHSELIRNSAEVVAARKAIEEARIAKLATAAHAHAATEARNIALTYTYWVHRWDWHRYNIPQYYSYYGWGYSGGATYAWDPFISVRRY